MDTDRRTYGTSAAFPELIGRTVAYACLRSDTARKTQAAPSIRVMNLRTGRLLRDVLLAEDTYVTDFDARQGAVAWMSTTFADFDHSQTPTYSVYKLDKTGQTLLASGQDVLNGSLAISGSTVYWTSGGAPHSAALATG